MARYLFFLLDGEMSSLDRRRLQTTASIYVEDGKTFVRIMDLPKANLEKTLHKIGSAGLRRLDRSFDLGVMPKHKDPSEESIAAYRLGAYDAGLPANPESDFEETKPSFKGCRRVKYDVALQVFRNPEGHIAAIGLETVVDEKFADFLKSLDQGMVLDDVIWKGKKIAWHRIEKASRRVSILNRRLSFDPMVHCQSCGVKLKPLRSTLIARPGVKLEGEQFFCNLEGYGHSAREPIFILSLEAGRKLASIYRSGYVLNPIYSSDSQTAKYMREIEKLLDEYVPARSQKPL